MGEFHDLVKVVYSSGPMEGCTLGGKEDRLSMSFWRNSAEKYLAKHNIDVINPVRSPNALNPRFVVRGDKLSIQKCDVLLVNFSQVGTTGSTGKTILGVGTIMEVLYGYELGKPVVIFDTNRSYEDLPVWLRYHSSIICNSQAEAQEWIVSLNNKKFHDVNFKAYDDSTQEGFEEL